MENADVAQRLYEFLTKEYHLPEKSISVAYHNGSFVVLIDPDIGQFLKDCEPTFAGFNVIYHSYERKTLSFRAG